MKRSLGVSLVLVCALLPGCAAGLILQSEFSGSGSPAGSIPGEPSGDEIVVQDPDNPVLSGGALVFEPSDKTFFFSRAVEAAETTKTIFWTGQLVQGDGPFIFLISANNTAGSIFLTNPIEVRFTNNQVQVIGLPPDEPVLHSVTLLTNAPHTVFISLRLGTGTYRMTIQQTGAAEIELTGNLDPLTANWIRSHSRIVLQAGFLSDAASSDTYEMTELIMRERN